MKNILFVLIVILGINTAQAQKLELGLHGGIGYNTMPSSANGDSILPVSTGFPLNYSASIKGITNIGRWQAGLGLDFQKITYPTQTTKFVFANPATTIYALGNYRFGRFFYIGLNAGIFLASSANYSVYSNNSKIPDVAYMEPGTGIAVGYQLGFSYPLGDKLLLNAEIGDRYTSYGVDYERTDKTGKILKGTDHYRYVFGYLNVGIRLKLFDDPFNQWLPYKRVN